MFRYFIVITASVLIAGTSVASNEESAEELLEIMNVSDAMAQSIDQMVQLELQNNPSLIPFRQVMTEFFQKHLSFENLKPEFVRIYADAFSEQEIRDMIDFYKTPTGQKTIEMMPLLMGQGAQVGQQRVQENIAELEALIAEEAQRLEDIQAEQD